MLIVHKDKEGDIWKWKCVVSVSTDAKHVSDYILQNRIYIDSILILLLQQTFHQNNNTIYRTYAIFFHILCKSLSRMC